LTETAEIKPKGPTWDECFEPVAQFFKIWMKKGPRAQSEL
jgi:hypothetical protein